MTRSLQDLWVLRLAWSDRSVFLVLDSKPDNAYGPNPKQAPAQV